MTARFLTAALLILAATAVPGAQARKECQMEQSYPPPSNASIPTVTIDLDAPAIDRWADLALAQQDNIQALIDQVTDNFNYTGGDVIQQIIADLDEHADEMLARMPNDYGDEIRGMSAATGIDIANLLIYNMAYEIFGVCTSVVAQDADGHMYHARNLDFGLFTGHNSSAGPDHDFQWTLTDLLRQLLVVVEFQRGGERLYSSVVFAGYVGLVTAVAPQRVSVSVDTRFDHNLDKYLHEWLTDPTDTSVFLTHALRAAVEDPAIEGFDDYTARIASTSLVGPSYAIVGGTEPGEGAVLSLGPNMTSPVDFWRIGDNDSLPLDQDDKFYVLETNYDHWDRAPFYDDRRTPAEDCFDNHVGGEGVSLESMYNVLHAHPSRNRLTTHTALMDCREGTVEASLQYCWERSCSPF